MGDVHLPSHCRPCRMLLRYWKWGTFSSGGSLPMATLSSDDSAARLLLDLTVLSVKDPIICIPIPSHSIHLNKYTFQHLVIVSDTSFISVDHPSVCYVLFFVLIIRSLLSFFSVRVMRPSHPLYRLWELVCTCFVMTSSFLVVYMSTFDSTTTWLHALLYTCDAVAVINVIATFWLAYEDEHGSLITDTSLIRRRYLCSYFFIDIFSAGPFELASGLYLPAEPYLRLNRLFRAYQLSSFFGNSALLRLTVSHLISHNVLVTIDATILMNCNMCKYA